jgi:hypothetical protein
MNAVQEYCEEYEMRLRNARLLLSSLALVSPLPLLAQAITDAPTLTIEQQLFNDFAVRMQDELHRSAALLDKIAQSEDANERDKLMSEYHTNMRTTMKIDHLMQQMAGGGEDMKKAGGTMMKGKKMGGMSCCSMMSKKGGAGKAAASDAGGDHAGDDAVAAEQAEGGGDAAADPHAGHQQ